jgi:hypothetical protein
MAIPPFCSRDDRTQAQRDAEDGVGEDEAEEQEGWTLTDEDKAILKRLGLAVARLRSLATCGDDLIAVGEVWQAIDYICEGEGDEIDINVGLSVGSRQGDEEFNQGHFMSLRIDWEGIVLGKTDSEYSSEVGSDHSSDSYATLAPNGKFNGHAVDSWLEDLERARFQDDVQLSASRDHI